MTPVEEFEAQGVLQPGTEGWWQVWGASVRDIKAGDIVIEAGDPEAQWFYVEETFTSKAPGLRKGLVVDGKNQTIGYMCRIGLVRRGDHNMLSPSAR